MEKRSKKQILFLLSAVLLLPGSRIRAAVPEQIRQEKQYITTDVTEKKTFANEIKQDGEIYELKNVSYEVLEKNPVKEKEKVTLIQKSRAVEETAAYQRENHIQKNGVTYLLKTVLKKKKKRKVWKQDVFATSQYTSFADADQSPEVKNVTVTDKKTGKKVTVACRKKATKKTAAVWVNSYIDILFSGYDANSFIWQGIIVKKNEKSPLKGFDKALIQSVGGNPDKYKVRSVSWNGKAFVQNGTQRRRARAMVRKKVPQYRVSYTGEIIHKEKKNTVYVCTYQGVKETETGENSYAVKAKADYIRKETDTKAIPVAVLTVSVVLVLATIVSILFLILRKTKKGGK